MSDTVYVEVTYPDGTTARWAIPDDDNRIVSIETLLGDPDTIKA